MKIAIVDDDLQSRRDLQQVLQHCEIQTVEQSEIMMFASGESFLESFKAEEFQLVFLDICMDGINGMETARSIRQQDERLSIVFLTNSADYALEGYQFFPAGYILKPVRGAVPQIREILRHCLPHLLPKMLHVRMKARELQLNVERIAYLDVQGGHRAGGRRGSVIHLLTGESMPVDTSYKEVAAVLKQFDFVECYNRLLVNFAAVAALGADGFTLKNGEQVPISRRLYRDTAHEYMEYLLRK